jgi:tungstate transport system permease protein
MAILSAVLSGFGRVIGEVGVAMMLGGNIRWYTRTLTTAIALETSKGEFELGLALGIILMSIALLVNVALHGMVRQHER